MGRFVSIFCLIFATKVALVYGQAKCPGLPTIPNVVLSCENPDGTNVPCQGPISGVAKRTLAKYKCEESDSFSDSNVMRCICKGRWKGMIQFSNFTPTCKGSSTFSLDGPPELNLSPDAIATLDNATANSNFTDFQLAGLAYHNFYRKLHGTSMLKLNQTLCNEAQKLAQYEVSLTQGLVSQSVTNRSYISNMYELFGVEHFNKTKAVRLAVGKWYSEGINYNYQVPVASSFSAMMWNSSRELGVGVASNGRNTVVICNYSPPGNVYLIDGNDSDTLTLFKKNVFPPVVANTTKSSK